MRDEGVDVDQAQVNVQNRVAVAQPRLPQDVQRLGVVVRKASPDLMMVVHMTSPDGSRDQQYISNYATLYVRDVLLRLAAATLSWLAAGLGYFWMLIDRDRLTWHDRLSATRVIRSR